MSTSRRRITAAAFCAVGAFALTACQYLPNVALRLNHDGTMDFGSCEMLDSVTSIDAAVYMRLESAETRQALRAEVPAQPLDVGDVVHLGTAPPPEEWDRVGVRIVGDFRDASSDVWGIFDQADLTPGEWQWAKSESAPFERVEHCDLGD